MHSILSFTHRVQPPEPGRHYVYKHTILYVMGDGLLMPLLSSVGNLDMLTLHHHFQRSVAREASLLRAVFSSIGRVAEKPGIPLA
jgi:hypothetical protein